MVRQSSKGKVLGKEKKLALVAAAKKRVVAKQSREDKHWKRAFAKMSADKKAKFDALTRVARKGVTRRSQRKDTGRKADNVAYECTIHLAKYLRGRTFNNRAPTAVKKIREFAQTLMRTKDNRIEADLNTAIWKRGVKGVPGRVRVRIQRKVGDTSNEAKPGQRQRKHLYSVISLAKNTDTKGKLTEKVLAKPGQQ